MKDVWLGTRFAKNQFIAKVFDKYFSYHLGIISAKNIEY